MSFFFSAPRLRLLLICVSLVSMALGIAAPNDWGDWP